MNKLLLSLLFILFVATTSAQKDYNIFRENENSKHQLGINKFYFVHHTFADSFFMTELYKQLSYDDMALILKQVYDGVTEKEKVNVEYKIDKPSDARIAYFFKEHEKNGKMFIMLTNFSNATRKFEHKPDSKDQLARWYFIKGEKLVYRKDLYSKKKESEKKKGETYELIDYYLFDDNLENDKFIKPLIDKLLNSNDKNTNKLYGYLYLSEFHLMNNDMKSSEIAIKNMEKFFEESTDIPKGYSLIVNMAKTEYEIMKRI
ncbi:hypothetical protein AWE51_25955 [Aquimarina aggregata]|uniref:Uncharacterized protein n=1 Tax=Aquimarina aggregata TaxID=1642818 RepID=A0A162XAP1_9FLAO|nr:hypothetical protein [Aquimarina aggregata]KZS38523.1 hypothetical protein AWE51_25955 [Aquimarina aggregata]